MDAREIIRDIVCADTGIFGTADEIADAILAALKEAGKAVVDVEPTKPMLIAARKASWDCVEAMIDDKASFTAIWSAMIAAAQEQEATAPQKDAGLETRIEKENLEYYRWNQEQEEG